MILHPRRYLLLALIGTILFAVVAVGVESGSAIIRFDRWIFEGCYGYTIERPWVHAFFRTVTDFGSTGALSAFGLASLLLLVLRRERFRALVWAAGLSACWVILPFAKDQFQRPRPPFATIGGYSFPSGHSFGSAVVYGLLGILIWRIRHPSRRRWVWAGMIWLVIPLVGLSRIMLGVHYFSDVVAGLALGLAWAFWCAAVADWWDRRQAG